MTDPTPIDATPPAAVPATVPATETAVAAPVAAAPARGKGLGRFALVLGILAFVGDIVLIVIALVGAAGAISSISGGNFDFTTIIAGLAGFAAIAFIGFWIGLGLAFFAGLFGLIAAITNRGRAAGIIGLILGLLVLISHVSVLGAIAGSGDAISQLGGIFG
jgi:hypothetical protein